MSQNASFCWWVVREDRASTCCSASSICLSLVSRGEVENPLRSREVEVNLTRFL